MDVTVIGGGPAGLSAAIYTARAGKDTLVLDKGGGTTRQVDWMENFYGFPDGISGEEIVERGEKHAKRFDAEIRREEVVKVTPDGDGFVVETTDNTYQTRGLILATGASYESPAIGGIDDYEGQGVSYCVECDAYFYRDAPVAVVGAGDYAVEEASALLDYTDEVYLLTDCESLDADEATVSRLETAGVEVITDTVDRVAGDDHLERVVFRDGDTLSVEGLFVALGAAGGTDIAETLGIPRDGPYLEVNPDQSTAVDGVYAAGDLTGGNRQVATSVGEGADAAVNLLEEFRGADYVDYKKLDTAAESA
ncbi:NAD(P)/FAD-dependent oxidoreductase [Halobaculum sp. MBLA0147]|uniref:NAD(P)/FAD-dependent oxidoreductase n=1 Tax=Halobaculum sp. MBLA0147 TaxID=3079934 RepID=UPI00352386B5